MSSKMLFWKVVREWRYFAIFFHQPFRCRASKIADIVKCRNVRKNDVYNNVSEIISFAVKVIEIAKS